MPYVDRNGEKSLNPRAGRRRTCRGTAQRARLLARRADALGLPRDLAVEPGSQQPEPLRKGPRWGPEPTCLTVRRTRRLLCAPSDRAGQVLQQQTAFGLKAILNFLQAIVNFFIFFFKTIMNPSAADDVSGAAPVAVACRRTLALGLSS